MNISRSQSVRGQFIEALGISSAVAIGMFAYSAVRTRNFENDYLVWNLFLAWLPLIFALRLAGVMRRKAWASWETLVTGFLWLIFLPNSFYMISDLIHLRDMAQPDILYSSLMFMSFIFTACVLGFSSLYVIHLQLLRRVSSRAAAAYVAILLLVCSAAIYLGRDLRWNSWDILTNPGGLLFDVSDRLLHPDVYPEMLRVIITFFVVMSSIYYLLWQGIRISPHTDADA